MSIKIVIQTLSLAIIGTVIAQCATANRVSADHIPLTFERNMGQIANSQVQFISRASGGTLLLYRDEIILRTGKSALLDLKLCGISARMSILGAGDENGRANYLLGNLPSHWLTNIPSYSKVSYQNIYANINLVIYGRNGQFESDFVVAPDADPSSIKFRLNGKLALNPAGDLLIQSFRRTFKLHRPFVYQVADNGERLPIKCRYLIQNRNEVTFAVDRYDRSKTLVIDPVLSYSSYLGGSDDEGIFGIRRDSEGNIYIAGETSSLNFPTADSVQSKEGGDYDCFVTKFDRHAEHLRYSTYLGGAKYDHCVGLDVNPSGEAFVAGFTNSTDFPIKNAVQSSLKGTYNGFVAHLDPSGSNLVFSTYLGGSKSEFLNDIVIDRHSNVYVAGVTRSLDFPVTPGAYQTHCDHGVLPGVCNGDAFVTKLSPDGTQLIYSTYLGGSGSDFGNGLALDFEGAAYITGQTSSHDFPTKSAYQSKLGGISNVFISKLSPDGSQLQYSTYVGGSSFDGGNGIAVDWRGNAYVTGTASSLNFPTVRPVQAQNNGHGDGFLLKLDKSGSVLDYSTYFGGSAFDFPFRIAVDPFGTASVVGFTASTDFPLKDTVQSSYAGGMTDAFVARFTSRGELIYSTYLGGMGDEFGYAVYSDPLGGVWVGGSTSSTDYPIEHAFQAKYAGGPFDAFLSRIRNQTCTDETPDREELNSEISLLQQEGSVSPDKAASMQIMVSTVGHCEQ